jgi:hypothetical protein
MMGYVYCIGREMALVKIGFSANPDTRLKSLQVGNAQRVEVIGKIPGDFAMERHLHEQFRHLRVGGEWFRDESAAISGFFLEASCGKAKKTKKRDGPHEFYRTFRDQWPVFLKAHFRNSAHIAAFFQVDDRTARDWLGGVSQPRGPVVAYAVATMPAETAAMVGRAA